MRTEIQIGTEPSVAMNHKHSKGAAAFSDDELVRAVISDCVSSSKHITAYRCIGAEFPDFIPLVVRHRHSI
jgi:hypothetical protein